MNNLQLEQILNQKLNSQAISDYAPNGLQIEGKSEIKRIVCGVTASQALVNYAIEQQADAIVVHHGYFWKNENPCITGMKAKRIKALLNHNINLYAYHLPLDIHSELGNNAQLAKLLGIENLQGLESHSNSIPMWGEFTKAISLQQLVEHVTQVLGKSPIVCDAEELSNNPPHQIKKIGLCSGGGQGYIDLAAAQGCDAYLSGEISEQTTHSAREQQIHYLACGHHATERGGIQALAKWLAENYALETEFIDIDNPA